MQTNCITWASKLKNDIGIRSALQPTSGDEMASNLKATVRLLVIEGCGPLQVRRSSGHLYSQLQSSGYRGRSMRTTEIKHSM